ncbi:MAG: ATP-dependent Clp protease proteolytic subunit [Rhizobiaceae bacterium]|nr:ATP-dependent Clp protease proteolytic subunit [Rhizobiaceae bacterium]
MAILVNGELVLYGFVGENYWGDGFTAREVLDALAEIGRDTDVTVRINSGGGYVDDGIAIYNALYAHKGKVTVQVDAIAASAASVILMAGDERVMRKGALVMIHDPSGGVWGTAADMEQFAKVMEKQADNLASIYADVTGENAADIREDMKSELWLTADEAVERGFATSVAEVKARAVAAHDYSVYAHAPERLVALSAKKDWTRAKAELPAKASANAKSSIEKETRTMTEKTTAENQPADTEKLVADAVSKALADSKARIKAIMASDEAKGREELAEYFAHDTEMPTEAVIAALAKAPKASASNDQNTSGATYEQQRTAASNLAMPGNPAPKAESGLHKAVTARIEAMKSAR